MNTESALFTLSCLYSIVVIKVTFCYECLAYFFLTMFLFSTGASNCGAAAEFTNACENLEKNEVCRDLKLNTHT